MKNPDCTLVIPDTFIACGEGGNYCSDECLCEALEPWYLDKRLMEEVRLLLVMRFKIRRWEDEDGQLCQLSPQYRSHAEEMARVLLDPNEGDEEWRVYLANLVWKFSQNTAMA